MVRSTPPMVLTGCSAATLNATGARWTLIVVNSGRDDEVRQSGLQNRSHSMEKRKRKRRPPPVLSPDEKAAQKREQLIRRQEREAHRRLNQSADIQTVLEKLAKKEGKL